MEPVIVPSIIAESQEELDEMLERVRGRATRIMLDIMDGEFVENESLNFEIRVPGGFVFEAHLMVKQPLAWLEKNGEKVDIAIFQVETLDDVGAAISEAHGRGLEVYLALNPETGIEEVLDHMDNVDGVLVLTVNPGSFCVEFIPETLEKVRRLREIKPEIPIEVDGCMNPDHIRLASQAGANIFDSGSYVMKSDDVETALAELRDAAG